LFGINSLNCPFSLRWGASAYDSMRREYNAGLTIRGSDFNFDIKRFGNVSNCVDLPVRAVARKPTRGRRLVDADLIREPLEGISTVRFFVGNDVPKEAHESGPKHPAIELAKGGHHAFTGFRRHLCTLCTYIPIAKAPYKAQTPSTMCSNQR
jgi:hypothetical protein